MTKSEREKLKEEIKREILAELKNQEPSKHVNAYDFDAYKKDVVQDDIDKVKEFTTSKMKWYWFTPFVGLFAYAFASALAIQNIDRGLLRVEIQKGMMRNFAWYFILYSGIGFIFSPLPWVERSFFKKAIKVAEDHIRAQE